MQAATAEPISVSNNNSTPSIPFSQFIENLKEKMKQVFHVRADIDQLSLKRGLPPFVMREIMSVNPLSVGIPTKYGGRGGVMKENIGLLAAASYESLALSLTFGINSALFLQPFGKFGQEEVKAPVFNRFLNDKAMGGLMITEPDYGSDALNMQTSYTESESKFHMKGKKHWAGLTGWADFWLLSARQKSKSDKLQRDIDFFLCDVTAPGQNIVVEEFFENLGLYAIPYGRNRIDVQLPQTHKLIPETTGVKMMLDLLHRSRMQFPGMAMGFIQRMLDEALNHCKERLVGGKSLFNYDRVQHRLSKLQASYTICSAMCANSSEKAGLDVDLSGQGMEANAVKSVITDLMQEAAQSVVQLVGAKAYKLNHIAGRGTADSRPFQIFEGSNDILYAQISEGLVKMMKRAKDRNLFQFLKGYDLTDKAVHFVKSQVDFNLDLQLPQRKLVEMGKIIGRVISLNHVLALSEKGFNKDLIDGSVAFLQQEITKLMSTFNFKNEEKVVDGYDENTSWLNFVAG
ncbi:acyl-CoA dehydrogenase family protein [Draconibacterium sp. IB214405]|uniref:acyl-CoA dehydrogenase family protein n=1 Tax=Draconibacterium sp. IB214405 TaxID=3097352 RepID=UPI002A0D200B|nr:acyl-CoA dehydrogenase family protein [Draconibacterium sp. IB214405]MDX8337880.1 acyl-CoA dehydrogenase family protein [Draconibacterium sp. IB214405]